MKILYQDGIDNREIYYDFHISYHFYIILDVRWILSLVSGELRSV